MLRQDDFIKAHLLTFAYNYTKEYGGHLAACMVMGALANRVRKGWGSWLEVIENAPKYAAEKNPLQIKLPSLWDANFVRLLTEVEGIYDGSAKDLSCGAVYFCDTRRIENDWFLLNIIRDPEEHPNVAGMNSLNFYK
jgi:hypothetical protein